MSIEQSQEAVTERHSYQHAATHYSSPNRYDPVKVHWEEVTSRHFYERQLIKIMPTKNWSVLDVGCGAGEGYRILRNIEENNEIIDKTFNIDYTGLDLSDELLEIGRKKYKQKSVKFIKGDITKDIPNRPFDLYFSSGVPFSHFTPDQMLNILINMFRMIKAHQHVSTIILDVLGRYSIEWPDKWPYERWPYRMNFFHGGDHLGHVEMSFYDRERIVELVNMAARDTGVVIREMVHQDRSIAVGRHTATREFNPHIAAYRTLVNGLYEGTALNDLDQLMIPAFEQDAPEPVRRFHAVFRQRWNNAVKAALEQRDRLHLDESLTAGDVQGNLAEALRQIENRLGAGFGVGHTLMTAVHVDGRRHVN